jgi:type III pantothenate kinase
MRYLRVNPLVVSAQIETGIAVAVDSPAEVGADRIVDALAAWKLYRVPAIVVDFGTATTFDAVSADGALIGTAIAPGFLTSMEGLYTHAAKLQRIEFQPPTSAIGRNTVDAMRSGWVYGYVGLVEGLVQRIKSELGGEPVVIATGGLAELVVSATEIVDFVDPGLTLKGLRLIYALNTAERRDGGPHVAGLQAKSGRTADWEPGD